MVNKTTIHVFMVTCLGLLVPTAVFCDKKPSKLSQLKEKATEFVEYVQENAASIAKTTAACIIPAALTYGLMCTRTAEKIKAESLEMLLNANKPHGLFWWSFYEQSVGKAYHYSMMSLEQINKEFAMEKKILTLLVGVLSGMLYKGYEKSEQEKLEHQENAANTFYIIDKRRTF